MQEEAIKIESEIEIRGETGDVISWDKAQAALAKMADYFESHPEELAKELAMIDAVVKNISNLIDTVARDLGLAFAMPDEYLEQKQTELDTIIESTLKGKE